MKKLVCKLLSVSITFTPVLSFNSNNYSHADIFGTSNHSRGVRVMTEEEFRQTCNYINKEIDDYIDRYLETPLGKKLGYKIFHPRKGIKDLTDAYEASSNLRTHYYYSGDPLSWKSQTDFLCDSFNANLPVACCRHWVSYFDKNYFSKIDRKYSILSYNVYEHEGHTLFLLCYYPKNDRKIPKYVILDPMAQFNLKCRCREIKADIEHGEWVWPQYRDCKEEELFNQVYNEILPIYYVYNNDMINKCPEYSGFLNIPLEKFFVYAGFNTKYGEPVVLLTRDNAGLYEITGKNSYCYLPTFLEHIYSADKVDRLSSLREDAGNGRDSLDTFLGEAICELVSKTYEGIRKNINKKCKNISKKCDKIIDKICMDIPIDVEFSDDDFMGFGS